MTSKHVVIAIPVLLIGGTEIQTLTMAKALISGGYRVSLCCYYEYDSTVADVFTMAGVGVHLMKLRRDHGLLHLIRELIKFLRDAKPDILHVQYLAPGFVPIIAARLAGIRTIFATVHIAGNVAYGKKAKFLLRTAAKLCTAFFCVSRGVEDFWFDSSELFDSANPDRERKHFTVYNAVDVAVIERTVKEINRDSLRLAMGISDRRVIGIVGRLAYQKGHAVLLVALVAVLQKYPDVILLVIGRGPEETALRMQAENLGVLEQIIWLGERKQEETFKLYGVMDMYVMPSLYEGFGLTAAEAMAASLPVVATEVDGLTEVVVNGSTGILVPHGNSRALSIALIELLSDKKRAEEMGRMGQMRVTERFSLKRFEQNMISAYRAFVR